MTLHNPPSAGSSSYKLPIELWDKIMQEVPLIEDRALTEKVFATGKARLGSNEVYYDNKFLSREIPKWRNCLRTSRSLVLVCRLWRDIFTPFLYSSLHITGRGVHGGVSSHQIVEILHSHPTYCHYVRRLEIWSTESATECAFLIAVCDRLRILGLPKDFDWTEVTRFVSDLPVIRHLSIRYGQPEGYELWNDLEPCPSIILPNLYTLQVSVYSDQFLSSPTFSFPSLRILKLDTLEPLSYPILWPSLSRCVSRRCIADRRRHWRYVPHMMMIRGFNGSH